VRASLPLRPDSLLVCEAVFWEVLPKAKTHERSGLLMRLDVAGHSPTDKLRTRHSFGFAKIVEDSEIFFWDVDECAHGSS
jgi:hypothetical protein